MLSLLVKTKNTSGYLTYTFPHRIIETKPNVFASGAKVWIKNCVKPKNNKCTQISNYMQNKTSIKIIWIKKDTN